MLTTKINGTEYELSTTLRVAYKVQGQHNHKPYTEIFRNLGEMSLEQQINILYAAFQCANPQACSKITAQTFLDYYLDNYTLKHVMQQLQSVVKGIMGGVEDLESDESEDSGN